jgi:hypothetical protein
MSASHSGSLRNQDELAFLGSDRDALKLTTAVANGHPSFYRFLTPVQARIAANSAVPVFTSPSLA